MEAKLGITDAEYKTWPVYIPRVGFTLSPGEVSEWKALIQDGIDYELTRIEKGGLPKALTLQYLRSLGDGKQKD